MEKILLRTVALIFHLDARKIRFGILNFTNVRNNDISIFIFKRNDCLLIYIGLFLDPECQNISSQHRCYTMDPSCPVPVPMNGNETTSHTVFIYIIIPGAILCLILIAFVSVVFFRKRLKLKKKKGRVVYT